MGNILIIDKNHFNDVNKNINELTIKNEALESQAKILKEMLKKDDDLIKNMERELREYNLNEENNTCIICRYLDKTN